MSISESEIMARYTIRTCKMCGYRASQPDMNQREVYVTVGKSRQTVSGATLFGAMLDDKRSKKAIGAALFNTGERSYTRKQTIWVCHDDDCLKQAAALGKHGAGDPFLGRVVKMVGLCFVGVMIAGAFASDKKEAPADEATAVEISSSTQTEVTTPQLDQFNAPLVPAAPLLSSSEVQDPDITIDGQFIDESLDRSVEPTDLQVSEPPQAAEQPTRSAGKVRLSMADAVRLENEFKRASNDARIAIQSALKNSGHYSGKVDGRWGNGTKDALHNALGSYRERYPGAKLDGTASVFRFFDEIIQKGL